MIAAVAEIVMKLRVCVCVYALGANNQHPSEVMGTMEEGRVGRASEVQPVSVCGGGLWQWDAASWSPAFGGGAPCLMGGREVNSTAPKLYLIFIHMNAPGRDRLPQTN